MNKSKCVEYYLDSRKYGEKEIQETIEKTKQEYQNKEIYVNVVLNKYGVYVLTFHFENKNNLINKIKFKITQIMKKPLLLTESQLNIRVKTKKVKTKKVKTKKVKTKKIETRKAKSQKIKTKKIKIKKIENKKVEDRKVKKQKAINYSYKGYNSNRKYGQYKETKEYKPL